MTLVECPFCGENLRRRNPPNHLEQCEEFYLAFEMTPPTYSRL